MRSVLGMQVEVKTPRQHYIGNVIGHLFKRNNYDVKINTVFKGNKRKGEVIRISAQKCHELKRVTVYG